MGVKRDVDVLVINKGIPRSFEVMNVYLYICHVKSRLELLYLDKPGVALLLLH